MRKDASAVVATTPWEAFINTCSLFGDDKDDHDVDFGRGVSVLCKVVPFKEHVSN